MRSGLTGSDIAPPNGPSPAEEAERHYREVLARLQSGDLAGALEHARAAAALRPGNADAAVMIGNVLLELDRVGEAEAQYREVLARAPDHWGAVLGCARCAWLLGDRAEAHRLLLLAEALPPAVGRPRLIAAQLLRDQGDFANALAAAQALVAESPQHFEAWLSIARTHRAAGDRAAAYEAFRRAAECEPVRPKPLVEMSVEKLAVGEIDAAAELLERALAVDPEDASAVTARAKMAIMATEFADALVDFRQLIASQRAGVEPYLQAAHLLVEMEDAGIADALALLDEAGARFGPLPNIELTRAALLRAVGDYDRALAVAWQAGSRFPGHFGVWFEQLRVAYDSGDICETLCLLDRSPAHNGPQRGWAEYFHALIAADRWCLAEAIAHGRNALSHDPVSAAAANLLAKLHLLNLDLPETAEYLKSASRLSVPSLAMRGLSFNPSQTMVGQIMDEYLLEAPALAEMLSAKTLAPHARIVALRSVAARYPDYTPAAMTLLGAMRHSGLLIGPAARQQEAAAIPKRIAQYWDAPELPNELQSLVASWREHNPEYEHTLFDDDAALTFLRRHYPARVVRAYRRHTLHPAQKADLFRLAFLYALGGIYADVDDRCRRRLSNSLEDGWELICYQEDIGSLGNNFIAAVPRHPVIGLALEGAVAAIERGDTDIVWLATGPGLLTRAFVQCLPIDVAEGPRLPAGILVLDRRQLAMTTAIHCQAPYKRSPKHWQRSAFARARSPETLTEETASHS